MEKLADNPDARTNTEPTSITVPKRKKLYEKPSFRFERVFETNALSCGKTSAQGPGQCSTVRKNS